MNLLSRLIEQAVRRPGLLLVATAVLSVVALLQIFALPSFTPRLKLDPTTESLLPLDDRDRQIFERVRNTFGEGETVLMSVRLDPLFTPDNMARIGDLTRRLRQFPGVKGVFSLGTAANVLAEGDDLEVSPFTEQAARDPESVKQFAQQISANPLYRGVLVSDDGIHTALAISLDALGEERFRRDDYPGQFRTLAREITGSEQVWLAGSPVVKAASTGAMLRTLYLSLPVIYLLIVLLLYAAFRSLRATLAVVATVSLALLWTLATAVAMGQSLNLVSIIMPPLVITLGLAYAIHLLSDYYESSARTADERRIRRREVMGRVGVGLLLAGTTTIAGFVALMPQGLPAVRDFALLSSIGVFYLFVLILFFLPALLDQLHCAPQRREWGRAVAERWADRIAAFDIRWRKPIVWVALILVPVDLWLASGIPVGTDYIRAFREGVPVREEYEAVNRTFDGANFVSVLIETHVNDALSDPELVRGVDDLQNWLRDQPEVGQAVSYVDHLKLLNQSLNENDPAYFSVPQDAAAIKQLLLFAGGEELRRVLDARLRSALITVRIKVGDSVEITRFVERVEAQLAQLKPPLNGSITGTPVLATRTVNEIGRGQWVSLAIACFAIWAMLALMFTSARAGLWALLPNLVPVSIYFGTLRLLDIPLNPTNSLIASIVLGVAVDDTVHFLTRFNRLARASGSEVQAVQTALRETLRPTTLTTIALCLGLLALTGSELVSQVQFGLLAAFTLFLAWVSELTLTPALGSRLRIVTLWDLLRLDLGQSPQHTIPLLSGLSLRQARVFALMSKLESHNPGELVIQQGDFARDMYVVVDGTLEVWIDRNGERKVLATMSRGAVVGEAGYFGQRRTANVSCVTAVRVLRFDATDLERLRRRYPWIAATVFRNLNRVQAERLARATAMLR
ncbi:MMPL family transporter [Panacagrimonas sp.]|uniref:MMPL family transporter n=1 Tax=Panacagrimonas sp. TaxID=2480088 RepID=UPI003B51F3D0